MIMADKDNDGIIMLYVKDKKAYPAVHNIEWEKLGDDKQ